MRVIVVLHTPWTPPLAASRAFPRNSLCWVFPDCGSLHTLRHPGNGRRRDTAAAVLSQGHRRAGAADGMRPGDFCRARQGSGGAGPGLLRARAAVAADAVPLAGERVDDLHAGEKGESLAPGCQAELLQNAGSVTLCKCL